MRGVVFCRQSFPSELPFDEAFSLVHHQKTFKILMYEFCIFNLDRALYDRKTCYQRPILPSMNFSNFSLKSIEFVK